MFLQNIFAYRSHFGDAGSLAGGFPKFSEKVWKSQGIPAWSG